VNEHEHVVHPSYGADVLIAVTPASAGWKHLSFAVREVAGGSGWRDADVAHERCLVVMSGDVVFEVAGETHIVTGRESVFDGLPHAMYLPPGVACDVTADRAAVIGIGMAPADGKFAPRFITPADVTVEMRGGHNAERQITHIVDPGQAERLLCVEVYTPSGNWSSYPPHRHDEYVPGVEVDLDEVYHYRIMPADGWGMQRLYDDARELDDVVLVGDGDTVLVRRGYHPVVMAPGYDGYYLNFLAGERPTWEARDEPDLAWVRGNWAGRAGRMRLPLSGTGR
jgi:5-deoxy-glucuronate isomerase